MQDLISALKALSDETRLRIINVLRVRECCVCEVMQSLDISQTRASRNLGILREAGFLKTRREGTWMLYSLDRESGNRYAGFLAGLLEKAPLDSELLKKDRQRLGLARRAGPGCPTK